ncbi:alpha/beta hydrolase [Chryseobacterium sp. T16E-39]|uniref:alpha/beta hydrolase n=1 Tax=Chryseobacterium sp. T16E-39 TaxID=2015076 RepID=UPI000B5B4064|nr:alpha/beta hydrolase [Chryseobacterium sp. T16E-39]ASK30193.1 alpha/beta hydrolase [Chryseobacterium sp. T16E-39]
MKLLNFSVIILLFVSNMYHSQTPKRKFQISSDLEQIPLWPKNQMPDQSGTRGGEIITDKGSVTNVSTPRLIVHRPKNPNGTAILVISGGGYAHIELGKESTPTSDWLQSEGITAFELIYRLPQEGWKTTNVPFEDAQRAMRLIRSSAKNYEIDPNKIGILGFSAGGHLAGMIATQPNKKFYSPIDAIDSLSARPDFTGLIYPVISMLPPNNKTHAFKSILGANASTSEKIEFSVERQVNAQTPPTFLAQAIDDPISPVENSVLMDNALKKVNVPVEMHLFQTGGHGWGLGKKGSEVAAWTKLFKDWIKNVGLWK